MSYTIAFLLFSLNLEIFAQMRPDVRLKGSNISTDGYVEILYNDTWGTICTEKFDIKDARVICRMLGYQGALAAVTKGIFGQGKGPTWLGDVCCHGDEKSILECPHQKIGSQDCDHNGDVGVVCNETEQTSPRVRLKEYNASDSSKKSPTDGRVEIFFNGIWGTICDDRFDIKDAHVICRMLGFPRALAPVYWGRFGAGSGQIWLDELRCYGNETTLFNCRHGGVGIHDCRHHEDIGVICKEENSSLKRVRLKTSKNSYGSGNVTDGMIEVFMNGQWGTICDDYFDKKDADVICRMMGFPGSLAAVTRSAFGKGTGSIWLDNLRCYGNETSFFDCQHNGIGLHNCWHFEDVGVVCQDRKSVKTKRVRLVSNITNSDSLTSGRVEVFFNEEWGTVCDDAFDMNDANVICGMLGYPGAFAAVTHGMFGKGLGRIWLDNLACYGNESHFLECPHVGVGLHNCRHTEDVGVICNEKSGNPPDKVRLVGTKYSLENEGRVEIQLNGEWGTICDDYFDINSAHVICRRLGFPRALAAVTHAAFGEGAGRIWFDNLRCRGNETSLLRCPHNGIGIHNCRHHEDVGVICQPKQSNPHQRQVRLVGYNNETSNITDGRVEVLFNGQWGTICDDLFDINDANVLCRQMGFSEALTVVTRGGFGQGTGKIWLDNLRCFGNETSFLQCPHGGIGLHDCSHREDVGVACIEQNVQSSVRLRLVGATNSLSSRNLSEGFVEVYLNGQWGTICDDYFDMKNARIICAQLGFTDALTVFSRGTISKKEGPIWIDNLRCIGNETSIFQCPHYPIGLHNCVHREDVGVVCLPSQTPLSKRVRLVDGKRPNEGRVEVLMSGVWGSICNAFFKKPDAKVICSMLGFSDVKRAVLWPHSNQSSDQAMLMGWPQCYGNETSIFNCQNVVYRPWCDRSYDDDIGVICQPNLSSIGPTNVTVTGIATTSALVLWDHPLVESSDIAEYHVLVNGSDSDVTAIVNKSRSYFLVKNLQPSSVYSVFVETLDNFERTAKSQMKNFKTKPASQIIAPEIIQLSIERVKTSASDNILLVCKATGSLPLNFTWSKEGSVLRKETAFTASVNLIVEPNGGASYKCQVENDVGKDSRKLSVTSENLHTLKQTQNRAQSQGNSSATLLAFFIISLIINVALIAGVVYLLRINRNTKQRKPVLELAQVKAGPIQEEVIGFENALYCDDEAAIVKNMEHE